LKIPLGMIQKVIEACRVNAQGFLDDARMIISKGRFGHAYVVVQLAIEELGKIVLLKERRAETAKRAGVWEISINRKKERENHKFKAQKAWTLLDTSLRVLHKGAFDKGFGRRFDVDTIASHTTRLECAYVDIDEDSNICCLAE